MNKPLINKDNFLSKSLAVDRRPSKDGLSPSCRQAGLTGFTVDDILSATGGRIIAGNKDHLGLGISSDTRSLKQDDIFIAVRGENFDGHNFIDEAVKKGSHIIIVGGDFCFDMGRGASLRKNNPLEKQNHLAGFTKNCSGVVFVKVADTVKALGDIANFHRRRFNVPIISITGSCGKTTTKDMVHEVLSQKFTILKNEGTFNNCIGLPHTLLKLDKEIDLAVTEMGTNHPGEIHRLVSVAEPNIGIITNIGAAHLEFFGKVTGVLEEKYDLIRGLSIPGLAILNGDDKLLCKKAAKEKKKTVFTFGIENKCDFTASRINIFADSIRFTLNNKHKFCLNVLGRHNIYNALAAIACGMIFGIGINEIRKRLFNFVLTASRINLKRIKNYHVIDDSYNSNPVSFECAVEALKNFNTKGKKIFVMGDMLELGEKSIILHRLAGKKIIESGIDALITVGRLSSQTADFVKNNAPRLLVYSCGCSLEAKGILAGMVKSEDLILVKGSRAMQMEKAIQDL